MKVTVRKASNHGKQVWFVDYTLPGGKRKRLSFAKKALADAEAERVRHDARESGQVWQVLTAPERSEIISVYKEIIDAGLSLRHVWERFKAITDAPLLVPKTLGDAYGDFIKEAKAALLSRRTLKALQSNVGRFVKGREAVAVRDVTRDDVSAWLRRDEWGPRTFNTYLTSLNTFFLWCKKLNYVKSTPTQSIDKIDERRMSDLDAPPCVLSVAQCAALLTATLTKDRGLIPYVACCLFGGLRPEREAARLTEADLRNGSIYVKGLHAKDRQRRLVAVHPTLGAWLELGGDLPPKNLRKRFEAVRAAAGLIVVRRNGDGKKIESTGWGQDVMRHTFASNYLPVFGAERTIAQLGHGDYDMLFQHYRDLVHLDDAALFWALTPQAVSRRLLLSVLSRVPQANSV